MMDIPPQAIDLLLILAGVTIICLVLDGKRKRQ